VTRLSRLSRRRRAAAEFQQIKQLDRVKQVWCAV